jgi:hypothetical protein
MNGQYFVEDRVSFGQASYSFARVNNIGVFDLDHVVIEPAR